MARFYTPPYSESDGWGLVVSLSGNAISIVLPLLAVIFAAIPLNQGKGTGWEGKGMAKAGLVTGGLSVVLIIYWVSAVGLGVS